MIYIQAAEGLDAPGSVATEVQGIDLRRLEEAARQVLSFCDGPPEADLAIVLAGDAQLQALNRQFLELDAPTDVLAFPGGETDPDSQALYLGDVIISCQRAAQQAQAAGHSLLAELQLLVAHGVLHLLGYDHATPEEKSAMWAVQAQTLDRLGCSIHLSAEGE